MAAGEILEVVDPSDSVLALAPRSVVHARGMMHRAVHVMLLRPDGRLYLQRRSLAKDTYPGCWTSSASGHVDPGEGYARAARRELAEELGLELTPRPVAYIRAQPATGWEFCWLFVARTTLAPSPEPTEIAEMRLVELSRALELASGPDASPSLGVMLRRLGRWMEGR